MMEKTNLSKQQQVSEIMSQMLTQAQTAGQYFTNDQIKEMIGKVSAEVYLVNKKMSNQRYGSSHIGATAKDISNVVTDAASGVVDIFHGIDKAFSFFSSRRRHTRSLCDWSSDVCSSDLSCRWRRFGPDASEMSRSPVTSHLCEATATFLTRLGRSVASGKRMQTA